ncbi:hypothetical protein C0431_12620 [bacterium]|nr:hypothetical protein [bacterium]
MAQFMILLNVDDEKLKENNPGGKAVRETEWVENELGWLEQSGMSVQMVVSTDQKEYSIPIPSQRVLPDEKLILEVGGDVDYPRVSIMRELTRGDFEEIIRLERDSDKGVRSVTYTEQDGQDDSENIIANISFINPLEVLFKHFRIEAHSLSAQRLSYDEDGDEFQYDSADVYGDTQYIYISDREDGFELCLENLDENNVLPEVASYLKELDYDIDLFKAEAPKKFASKKEGKST